MALSSDLISKFVKATKDKPTAQKETVVYGVVTQLDPVRVKLIESGSTSEASAVYGESIPVASQTTVVEVGDKVECTIKNHKLSITGTSDYPAARDSSTINVSQLNASNARIDNLEAANVDIQGTLTATNADIENLKASNVDVTGRLTAAEADIEQLKALDIDVETLNAAKAFIEDLEASDADIDYLVSTVAEIDTLIFGSASGNVIQTSFSNAVIAQLGDAQIKSAMIESVSASKITAGDIITNNVRVMSEDGSLIISDETLQISDSNRVRVQIGKDAANDYSINVWDQNGKLMFSKGGITDAAIKEAIIRNDMISDTANIHASKLDIDSLFEEINDSSNTIKSTQVKLDDRNQTLDVAFKTLTNEITSQGNTISSQGTQISTIQGQISSKIWQQDINTAKNSLEEQTETLSTKYSTLEQNLNGFKTTVSNTYATISDVNNIEIGGRNYILDSANIVVTSLGSAEGSKGEYRAVSLGQSYMNIPAGTEVTVSFDLRMTVNTANPRMQVYNTNNKGPKSFPSHYFNFSAEVGTIITQRCSFTTELIDRSEPASSVNFMEFYTNYGTSNWFEVTNLKMEIGNKATDWSPAPEDIDTEITNLDSRILSAESSITQLNNSITANVTETTNLGTRMTTVEQTAESLSVEVENLEIGGRNLIQNSSFTDGTSKWSCTNNSMNVVNGYSGNGLQLSITTPTTVTPRQALSMTLKVGDTLTGSVKVKVVDGDFSGYQMRFANSLSLPLVKTKTINDDWTLYVYQVTLTSDTTITTSNVFGLAYGDAGTYIIDDIKLEKGNRATDWSPAPEDVENDILDASKTATNYLNFSSSGLVIGDLTSSTLGKNVLIDSDSVDIRNGTTTLASFGADYLYLAKNSRNAKIDLCNGLAQLYHQSKYSYDTLFVIDTPNATEIQGTYNPLCVTSTVSGKVSIQFANTSGVIGSIGMVESGTESYITRNHPSTAATYSILDTGNYYKLMDSGWIYGGTIGDGFSVYADDTQIQYRKIGKTVHIRGAVKPTKDIAGSATSYDLFTLPSGYRPSTPVYARCQGSSANTWLLSITAAGVVRFSRYGYGNTYVTATAGTWLPFDVTFFID